ncbi:putative multidrug resistance protein [Setaria viridis]|uniref:putative multidrug resistance protein n=1 Tax=Setaria viridis TaxID=4556 RepID=UPI003B3B3C10
MRARYLRAVLRQDMEYFDLRAAGMAPEVVASVSNDSLVVQDALAERVPNFAMNATMFAGSYAVAFFLLWRLALVALPSVLLLAVPGFMSDRVLTGLAPDQGQVRAPGVRGRAGRVVRAHRVLVRGGDEHRGQVLLPVAAGEPHLHQLQLARMFLD